MKKKNLLVTAIMSTAIGMFFFFGCKKYVQNAPQGQQGWLLFSNFSVRNIPNINFPILKKHGSAISDISQR
jgi:hypothetical protein